MSLLPASQTGPAVNHVFVDCENVPPLDLTFESTAPVDLTLLFGARQTKLDLSLVEKLIGHIGSVQVIRLTSAGKNALDFALAYYVGRAVAADPTAYFHIVAKDKGYEALITHLRSRKVRIRRHDDFSSLPFSGPSKAPATDDPFQRVLAHLRKNASNRPKRKKTLVSHVKTTILGTEVTDAEALELVERLCKGEYLVIDEKGALVYKVS